VAKQHSELELSPSTGKNNHRHQVENGKQFQICVEFKEMFWLEKQQNML